MVMKYRSRTDIVAQILELAANGPITKTVIMYEAFLSHTQVKDYLTALIERGLIKLIHDGNKYITTEVGVNFLKMLNELSRLSDSKDK
jgi:predicted transcriptional regulator